MRNNSGVYKFVYGSSSAKRTVLRSATDLMLDAMREMDESAHQSQQNERSSADSAAQASPFTPLLGLADSDESQESSAIAAAIDDFAANAQPPSSTERLSQDVGESASNPELESQAFLQANLPESTYVFETPAPDQPAAEELSESPAESADRAITNSSSPSAPSFANYSIVPYAGNDIEDIT